MGKSHNVVVVSDEHDVHAMLRNFLPLHGFTVTPVETGEELRRAVSDGCADLVIIDIELPGECGLAFARYIHEHTHAGIVTLTVAESAVDRIACLEAGADDCLVRPVDMRELVARMKAVLRRTKGSASGLSGARRPARPDVRFGDYILDLAAHKLLDRQGHEVALTAMEFRLLKTFAEHPNRALNRDELAEMAYDREWTPFDRSLDIRISRLRRKIERNPANPQVITTVRGVGYRYSLAS